MNGEPSFFYYTAGVDVPADVPRDATRLSVGGSPVVEAGLFMHRESMRHLRLARVELREGARAIGRRAFYDRPGLGRVDLPSSLRDVGDEAFAGCASLPGVDLPPGIRRIGAWAFWGHAFGRVAVPSSVREVGEGAFASGEDLAEATLDGGTVLLARRAFHRCPRLRAVAIPPTVVLVEDGVYGSGRASVVTAGTIALGGGRDPREPNRLVLASPYLAAMGPTDVARAKESIDEIAGGRPPGEGPLDLAWGADDFAKVREGADAIRARFLGLLSKHRRVVACLLERAPLWESEEGGGVEPGLVGIVLSFLGDVEG